jgi:nitrile hydratase
VEGDSPKRSGSMTPKFAKGEKVYVKNVPSIEHTRLPGYLRDRVGVVDTVYPDLYTYLTNTGPDGIGEAMPVYCVKFDPQTIWKGNTDAKAEVYADLYEAYLEKAN